MRRRRHAARAPDGQHVAAGLEQPLGRARALPRRRQPGRHRRAQEAVRGQPQRDAGKQNVMLDTDGRAEVVHAAQLEMAKKMTERAQDFYVSLGMPELPASYWEKAQFIKPRDRDVVCHASAWDMNMKGDVRTKMCIKPNEEDFTTIYHELGHVRSEENTSEHQ